MKFTRDFDRIILKIFEAIIPPIIRDQKWFMYLPLALLTKKQRKIYFEFKYRAYDYSDYEFTNIYKEINSNLKFNRETDLNKQCVSKILEEVKNENVLEVGCGRGYLANLLSKNNKVTAVDIDISEEIIEKYPSINFQKMDIHRLEFENDNFDSVICTHTLEHVKFINKAISELRRVAKKRIIIVIPRERPYKYTFNLHLHFFPYSFSVNTVFNLGLDNDFELNDINGDWFLIERLT